MAKLIGHENQVLMDDHPQVRLFQEVQPRVPFKGDRLNKAVEVVHMYPVNGQYSHYQRRVFNALLVVTARVWNKLDKETQDRLFSDRRVLRINSTIAEIRRVLGQNSNAIERIYQSIETIYKLEFRCDVMRDSAKVWMVSTRLISQWAKPKAGSGEVEWEFPPDVFEMLMKPGRWTSIDLQLANRFNRGMTLALYENTCRYLKNPAKTTARLTVSEWINILHTGASTKSEEDFDYRYFKRDFLMKAITELNETAACPYVTSLIEFKGERNKTTHLQFRMEMKRQIEVIADETQAADQNLQLEMRRHGLSEAAIERFTSDVDERLLRFTLKEFERRLTAGTPVRDASALLAKWLHAGYCANAFSAQEQTAAEELAGAEARHATKIRAKVESEFVEFRQERVRESHEQLSSFLKKSVFENFRSSGGMTETVADAYAKKGFDSPVVLGAFFAWFAKQDGVLQRPEEATLEGYLEWRASRAEEGQLSKH